MAVATYLHSAQALLAAWGGIQSGMAITRLQTYESASVKLAEWSSEAARQLRRTRTTQASGAAAFLASFTAAAFLAIGDRKDPSSILASPFLLYNLSPVMVCSLLLARGYMRSYWAPKGDGKKVGWKPPLPMMDDYNEAQRRTENILAILEVCAYSWMAATVVVFFAW